MSPAVADPLAQAAVAAGHRELLGTFAELRDALAGGTDAEGIRAAVAFLRQGVVPFSREEERVLGFRGAEAEAVSFEHAFLAAEIDALAAEVGVLLGTAAGPGRERAASLVRRRADRIEAVLELHVLRGEDRGIVAPAPAPAAPGRGSRPRAMTDEEAGAFLRDQDWGLLCTVGASGPYAVPVGFGWDGRSVYFAVGPGRKAENLGSDARVCLTVAQVENGDRWRSVVVSGTAEPVSGVAASFAALAVIGRPRGATVSVVDAARMARARVFRLAPREISGRVRE